jgi:hypothetical protein
MSKIKKKVIEKRYIIFAKKRRKKDTETVIHFANWNLRSTYFDQHIYKHVLYRKNMAKVEKKIVKRVQDLPKKMPKVEMPVNFKFAVNVSGQSSGLS